ncbi:hypothetical protein GCM10008023_08160 [Sphingomonas glacialis]|uniref:Uncharacterized protein n=1 Tax=Sphingomonas glacialis TaxID=658225 RepID=A0ABQ3LBM2_9SPHN|nr:hypothetical protein GCM10008023_08160 [Sphingomonas glacialis]
MARLVGDQLEQDEPQLAAVEHPPAARATAPLTLAPTAAMPGAAPATEVPPAARSTAHAHTAVPGLAAVAAAF